MGKKWAAVFAENNFGRLAFQLRKDFPAIQITESHPKALLKACYYDEWENFANKFKIPSCSWRNEHERDAILAAICAREGFQKRWKTDLSQDRYLTEQNPMEYWLAPIHYYWPREAK